jgi:dTDP-4-dehydrorhamnose 3,5-epimerase
MEIEQTPIKDLYIIKRKKLEDNRGFFSRFFCLNQLESYIGKKIIKQINQSYTKKKGSVRGMHFQKSPNLEMKIVSVIKGEIYDVAVDLRKGSPTFLNSFSINLSENNMTSLLIPEGFAHGFQTLSDNCEMIYLHTEFYTPQSEGSIHFKDTMLNIIWPLDIVEVSDKDLKNPFIDKNFEGI